MIDHNLNICLYPMPIKWFAASENLESIENSLSCIHPSTDILVLPETFATGFPSNADKEKIREILASVGSDEILIRIKGWAKRYNIAVAGSIIVSDNGELFNRGFFIEPNGDEYFADKRHLFSLAGEGEIFKSGNERLSVRFRGWNITMIICYDIRFPVWCRNRMNEYDLLIAVANWPQSRIGAWKKLLPARAIENEAYVAGVNCYGKDNHEYEYDATSLILDYKGEDIGKSVSPFIYATLDKGKLHRFREKFPAWKDADKFHIDR